ncbi:uncharacterized protein LOC109596665 [Aethina tumida]|uniref:uncharacterized protein LOC109596665 n=1 Tax=Aethina tumida TaxID=116153 RepID=UPI0021488BEA|nr:uncharacterized protein LOC109596665 [Aethina tumida]
MRINRNCRHFKRCCISHMRIICISNEGDGCQLFTIDQKQLREDVSAAYFVMFLHTKAEFLCQFISMNGFTISHLRRKNSQNKRLKGEIGLCSACWKEFIQPNWSNHLRTTGRLEQFIVEPKCQWGHRKYKGKCRKTIYGLRLFKCKKDYRYVTGKCQKEFNKGH